MALQYHIEWKYAQATNDEDQRCGAKGNRRLRHHTLSHRPGYRDRRIGSAKFYNGQRGLSMESLDRLGEYLNLRIVIDRKASRKGR